MLFRSKRAATSSVTKSGSAISDVPDAPTVGTPTDSGDGTTASVPFTAAATGGGSITSYTVTSSPGGFTGTGASSPISVTGLTAGTAYTFTATATNSSGTSSASSASSSLTLASVGSFFLIQRITQPYGTSYVDFTNIPQTYAHLQVRISATTSSAVIPEFFFNDDGYAGHYVNLHSLYGNGTTAYSSSLTPADGNYQRIWLKDNWVQNQDYPFVAIVDVYNYASTTKLKNIRALTGQDKNGSGEVSLRSGMWLYTTAVTSIRINFGGVYPEAYWALYGIKG